MAKVRRFVQRVFGALLALLSPIVIALAIADLVITSNNNCFAVVGCSFFFPATGLTWVAVGIWAPVFTLVGGVLAYLWARRHHHHNKETRSWLCLWFTFLVFLFTPLIVVVSSLEVHWKFPFGPNPAVPFPSPSDAQAAYGIEITIAVFGGILWLLSVGILYLNCCYFDWFEQGHGLHRAFRSRWLGHRHHHHHHHDHDHERKGEKVNYWSSNNVDNYGVSPFQGGVLRQNYYSVGPNRLGALAPAIYAGGAARPIYDRPVLAVAGGPVRF